MLTLNLLQCEVLKQRAQINPAPLFYNAGSG